MTMAETLIASSVLIIAILALRPFLRRWASPTAVYALWGLVAIRLVAPWVYPFTEAVGSVRSRLSVMNAVDRFQREVIEGSVMEPLADNIASGRVYRYDGPVHLARQAAGIDWQLWIMVVWGLGFLVLTAWMIGVNLRFMRRLQASRRLYTGVRPGYVTRRVYVVPELSSPCYFGIGSDEGIYLPEGIAGDEKAVLHALAHETGHGKHGDRYWGILRCALLCFYWIDPFVWVAAVWSKRDCELACDEAAVKLLGEEERYAYGRTLVGLIAERGGARGLLLASTSMTAGRHTVRERIGTLARHPRTTALMAVVLAAVVAVLGACAFTDKTGAASSGQSLGQLPAQSSGQSPGQPSRQPQGQLPAQSSEQPPGDQASAGAGEPLPAGAGPEARKDVLVLVEDRQQGNYCEIVLQRQSGDTGAPKPVFADDYATDHSIDVTAYRDTQGQDRLGGGHPEQGFGASIEKDLLTLRIWNRELAGSFRITVTDRGEALEYVYVPREVEPISQYTLAGDAREIKGSLDTSVWLKSVEEFPNALGIVLRGKNVEEASEFYDGNDILLIPIGAGSYEDYVAPRSSGRDGAEIYLLYLFPGEIPPLSQIQAFAAGRGIRQEDYVETVLDEYQITTVARKFVRAWLSGDTETAAKYSDIPGGKLQSGVREQSLGTGTLTIRWNPMEKETYAEAAYAFYEEGQKDSLTYLYLAMKRVFGEWIVTETWLEK